MDKIDCPICKGTGKLDEPNLLPEELYEERKKVIKTLHEAKYSVREITKIMNYKSTRSVWLIIKDRKK